MRPTNLKRIRQPSLEQLVRFTPHIAGGIIFIILPLFIVFSLVMLLVFGVDRYHFARVKYRLFRVCFWLEIS